MCEHHHSCGFPYAWDSPCIWDDEDFIPYEQSKPLYQTISAQEEQQPLAVSELLSKPSPIKSPDPTQETPAEKPDMPESPSPKKLDEPIPPLPESVDYSETPGSTEDLGLPLSKPVVEINPPKPPEPPAPEESKLSQL